MQTREYQVRQGFVYPGEDGDHQPGEVLTLAPEIGEAAHQLERHPADPEPAPPAEEPPVEDPLVLDQPA